MLNMCIMLPHPTPVCCLFVCFAGFNAKRKKKVAKIYQALNSDPTDVAALRRMAISEGGLLTDEMRRKVWPKLLNVNTSDPPPVSGKMGSTGGGAYLGGKEKRISESLIFMPMSNQE